MHTGHVVMDSLLLCPVCGAGGGSHYIPDRKPVTSDDLGLPPSIRGDGREKKKKTKTKTLASEDSRRRRQKKKISKSGSHRSRAKPNMEQVENPHPEKEHIATDALRKQLLKLVVGSGEYDTAIAKSHRKMRNRKAMRELGVRSAVDEGDLPSLHPSRRKASKAKGKKKESRRRRRLGERLKASASLPTLTGGGFTAGNVHFDMR